MKKQVKRTLSILLSAIIIASLFAIVPIQAGAAVPAWKTAYINYIKNDEMIKKYGDGIDFKLYDFDQNGIPELIVDSHWGFYGGTLLTFGYDGFNTGRLDSLTTFGGDGCRMIYGNKILDSSGRMGAYTDVVYQFNGNNLQPGKITTLFFGLRYVDTYKKTYKYKTSMTNNWQKNLTAVQQQGYVSQQQYESKLSSIFDKSKALMLTSKNCSNKSKIISEINNYNDIPFAPTVSVANGVNGLDVAWGKVANAQSYVVYYKTASTGWSSFSTTSTRATITNVGSGKYYYVQVQSIGANGVKGNYSKVKTMTYLSRVNITSLVYNGNNTLKWNAVPGANKYQIARLKSGDKAYTYLYTTTPSLIEKNAVGGIAYTYQVRAMYQTTNSGTAYGAWSSTKSVPTLVAPTVTLSNKSNGIRVTWNSIRGAIRYIVYYKKSTDKGWSSAVTTNLYYPILNAQRGALYYVQVRPVGATVSQPYSSVKSIVFK